jgi:hypothetical protein
MHQMTTNNMANPRHISTRVTAISENITNFIPDFPRIENMSGNGYRTTLICNICLVSYNHISFINIC